MTGNATYMASGVFRQSVGITDAALKALDVWDQTRYYNIWAVSEIDGSRSVIVTPAMPVSTGWRTPSS